jgi:hypothetical protein
MLTYKDFNLRDDPFTVAPPKDIVWADRENFVRQLRNAIKRSLLSSPSRIVACIWGDWGAGKTHAMTYFSKPDVMQGLIGDMKLEAPLLPISLQITFPAGDVSDTIYLEIIEQIGVDRIIQALKELEPRGKTIGPVEALLREVSKYMDARVAEAFVTLKAKKPFLFQRYLSMTATSTELKNSGVARGIDTPSDKIRTISGILNLVTATIASRVFIWFDDLERIGDLPGREVFAFQYLIRDLLDNVPSNLVIIFNMTLLPGEEVEDRLVFLGDAIRYRISDKITVEPFTKDEFLSYVHDLLSHYRIKPRKEEAELFPFEPSALDTIFSELKNKGIPLEPRNVNEALSSTLFEVTKDPKKKDPAITKVYIETHLKEILSRISLPKR